MKISDLQATVSTAKSVVVGRDCVLGFPREARVRAAQQGGADIGPGEQVTIGERSLVFNQVIIYEGTRIGEDCVIEDQVRIGYRSVIGPRTRVVHRAYVCDRVNIGADATVSGFICDGARIGERSTVMGQLVHEYTRPHLGWWGVDEAPPVIEDDTVVGFDARVVGGIRVGPRSYVAAGAIVTKDVSTGHVVTGINVHTRVEQWSGRRLQSLIGHWSSGQRAEVRSSGSRQSDEER